LLKNSQIQIFIQNSGHCEDDQPHCPAPNGLSDSVLNLMYDSKNTNFFKPGDGPKDSLFDDSPYIFPPVYIPKSQRSGETDPLPNIDSTKEWFRRHTCTDSEVRDML
jgi:hypothetical protein